MTAGTGRQTVVGNVCLIPLGTHTIADRTAAARVDGLQGRHLLPLSLLVCLTVHCTDAHAGRPAWAAVFLVAGGTYTA